jgi:protein SCO1
MAPHQSATTAFRAPPSWIVWFFLLLGIGAVAAAFFIPVRANKTQPEPTQTLGYDAPIFVLTERSGAEVSNEDFSGKVWIVSFVFTRCTMGCPQVTTTMARLQKELNLANRDDLRLVTITVDPERDSAADLKTYADSFQAHPTRWLFLTGKEKLVRLLLNKGFKIAALKRNDPKPGDEYDHSTKLLVIDKKGSIRGSFDGMVGEHDTGGQKYEEGLKALNTKVGELVNE